MGPQWTRPIIAIAAFAAGTLAYNLLMKPATRYENWRPCGPTKSKELSTTVEILSDVVPIGSNVKFRMQSADVAIWSPDAYDSADKRVGTNGEAVVVSSGTLSDRHRSLLDSRGIAPEKLRPRSHTLSASDPEVWKDPESKPATGRTEAVYRSGRVHLKTLRVLFWYSVTPYQADERAPDGTVRKSPIIPIAIRKPYAGRIIGEYEIKPE